MTLKRIFWTGEWSPALVAILVVSFVVAVIRADVFQAVLTASLVATQLLQTTEWARKRRASAGDPKDADSYYGVPNVLGGVLLIGGLAVLVAILIVWAATR